MFDILLRLLNIAFCAVLLFGPTYASAGLYPTLGFIANTGGDPAIVYTLPLATSAPAACDRTTYKSYFCPATEYGAAWCSWRPQCWSGDSVADHVASVCSYKPVSARPRNAIDIIRYTGSSEPRQCSCPEGAEPDRWTGWCMQENAILSLSLFALTPTQPRPKGTGGTSTVELIAKVTEGANPKAGISVSFESDVQPRSGGHDHDNVSRPKGTLNIAQGTTDANGEVKVTFTAPAIAGIHTVKATCSNCTGSPASKEVKVKVPDLVEMPPDSKVPPRYTLVGQTANHASNHWFTLSSRNTLYMVVDAMVKTGWGAVGINDGSLMWGGLFDIKGNWSPSHSEHRTGNEVDISVTNPGLVSAAKKKTTYAELCKKENTAFSLQTLWHVDDGYPEHFHMYLDGTGLTSQAGGGPCCARYKTTRAKKDRNGNPVLDTGGKPVQETVALCEETSSR